MRYIVYGAGAIGCTLGSHLFRSGQEVRFVGRGEQLAAIRRNGLRFYTGDESWDLDVPISGGASDVAPFDEHDVVLLCVKSQHTLTSLGQLKGAGAPRNLVVVCCQNGIWNEPTASRVFHRIYGMNTVVPAVYLEPGVVINPMTGRYGFVEVGRFPSGVDSRAVDLVDALTLAGFAASTHPEIMMPKAAKSLGNLANVVRALLPEHEEGADLIERLRSEAIAVWSTCGIEWEDFEPFRRRILPHPGRRKIPAEFATMKILGSSWQSLQRGAGSIETELLNGEIGYLGRLVGVPTPWNDLVTKLGVEMARNGEPPNSLKESEILGMA